MISIMTLDEFIALVDSRIAPYSVSANGRNNLAKIYDKFPSDILRESVDIGAAQYFKYNKEGVLTKKSVEMFLDKLGGIAYNKTLTPIEQRIGYIKRRGAEVYNTWDPDEVEDVLQAYVNTLRRDEWSEEDILEDLKKEVPKLFTRRPSMRSWINAISDWMKDIEEDIKGKQKKKAEEKEAARQKEERQRTENFHTETFEKMCDDLCKAVNQLKSIGKAVGEPMDDITQILKKYDGELAILQQIESKLMSMKLTDDPETLKAGASYVLDIISGLIACHQVLYRGMDKEQEESALPTDIKPVDSEAV